MRYLMMKNSSEQNITNNELYPDVLTMNLKNITFSDPVQYELTSQDILRFDLLFTNYYGRMDYMDIVLIFNNIEHRSDLSPGDTILLPRKEEIDRIILSRKENAT